jgi:hypothetical protein
LRGGHELFVTEKHMRIKKSTRRRHQEPTLATGVNDLRLRPSRSTQTVWPKVQPASIFPIV